MTRTCFWRWRSVNRNINTCDGLDLIWIAYSSPVAACVITPRLTLVAYLCTAMVILYLKKTQLFCSLVPSSTTIPIYFSKKNMSGPSHGKPFFGSKEQLEFQELPLLRCTSVSTCRAWCIKNFSCTWGC